MHLLKHFIFAILFSVFTLPVYAGSPDGSVYLDGGDSPYALILCHGRGKHPRWKVVEPLRVGVHEILGYHTLSLQLPADNKNWREYATDFPEAYKRIKEGIAFLQNDKGVKTIYLMGHSMGSRMASAFVSKYTDQPVDGLIVVGLRNNGGYPLSGKKNLKKVSIPVLDIYGNGGDGKDADHATGRSKLVSDRYKQVAISGANHKFSGHEDEFVNAVIEWLESQSEVN